MRHHEFIECLADILGWAFTLFNDGKDLLNNLRWENPFKGIEEGIVDDSEVIGLFGDNLDLFFEGG